MFSILFQIQQFLQMQTILVLHGQPFSLHIKLIVNTERQNQSINSTKTTSSEHVEYSIKYILVQTLILIFSRYHGNL